MLFRNIHKLFRFSSIIILLQEITKYTKEHEWVIYDTKTQIVKIGITDHAQSELGDIVHIELPKLGLRFIKGFTIGAIESVKVAADLYAPLSGEVIGVNEDLRDLPHIVNENAEEVWILQAKVNNQKELDDLLDKEQYDEYIKN